MKLTGFPVGTAALAVQILTPGVLSTKETSRTPFSSSFQQPEPPLIQAEIMANWNQHKWDDNVSNIASGYLYSSPSLNKVRVDMAYDTVLGSSLFDYNNVTDEGVANVVWTLSPAISSPPDFFVGRVQPAFPVFPADILLNNNAVFAGDINDPHVGLVTAWNILYQTTTPTTVLVDGDHVVRGYDFWSPNLRTYAITRFFNVKVGTVPEDVFDFPE